MKFCTVRSTVLRGLSPGVIVYQFQSVGSKIRERLEINLICGYCGGKHDDHLGGISLDSNGAPGQPGLNLSM